MKTFLFILLFITVAISAYLGNVISPWIVAPVLFIGTWLSFKIYDSQNPAPRNLTASEIKSFFMSKVFWAAFISLVLTVMKGLFKFEIPQDAVDSILVLDWSNILQAALATVIILLRKVDVFKYLL